MNELLHARRPSPFVTWLLVIPLTGTACRPGAPDTPPSDRLLVYVSIPPQVYFVQRVGGSRVEARALIGPGQSHHTFEPTPRQLRDLAAARAYVRIGVPFERGLLDKIAALHADLKVIDTTAGVPFREADADCAHEPHDHDADHAHAGGRDPHIWLSPRLVKIQAATICNALCALDPSGADEYRANLKTFHDDLDAVDARIAKVLEPLRGREFFVFHPAYGYFGDAYGMKQVAVEQAGKEPSLRQLEQVIARARAANVRLILVQPQFPAAGAETVARAIGGAVVPVDPLATDYLHNLEEMARRIAESLDDSHSERVSS
jgi:zinc transport system substrate-binding protein